MNNTIFLPAVEPSSTLASTKSAGPSATYKCESCNIVFTSIRKLEDHVDYSPLHNKTLHSKPKERKLVRMSSLYTTDTLHSGLKLFWRLGLTLQVDIYRGQFGKLATIVATIPEDEQQQNASALHRMDISPVSLDLDKIVSSLRKLKKYPKEDTEAALDEAVVEFILERIEVEKDDDDALILKMLVLASDPYESVIALKQLKEKVKAKRQRRHTIEEIEQKRKEFNDEAKKLREARLEASKLVNATRFSLDAFTELSKAVSNGKRGAGAWVGAYARLQHRAGVLQTRALLDGDEKAKRDLQDPQATLKAALSPKSRK